LKSRQAKAELSIAPQSNTTPTNLGQDPLMGRQIILKWSYLMIFMRVLVAVSVRWCKVYRSKNDYAWSS